MKLSHIAFTVFTVFSCSLSHADTRNPFDPTGAKTPAGKLPGRQPAPGVAMAPQFPALPPVLPPPLPAARPPAPSAALEDVVEQPEKKKAKASQRQAAATACPLKVKSESVAAPAFGGLVEIELQGSSKSCVSAVMVEQSWLEVQELNDPSAIRIAVDANENSTPRQSNIVIANAGRSVTVTLVQEGRVARTR